jgi:hypothetical protein
MPQGYAMSSDMEGRIQVQIEGAQLTYVQMSEEIDTLRARVAELEALINNPHTTQFLQAVRIEAAHQVERWGTVHDRAKEPQDWLWLVGHLAGKALRAHIDGDEAKATHHTISTAAVMAQWFAHIKLGSGAFTPGSSDLQQFIAEQFGPDAL